jgi:hypothetical protein
MPLTLRGTRKIKSMVLATKALELLVQSVLIGTALIHDQGSAFAQRQQETQAARVGEPKHIDGAVFRGH